MNPNWLLYKQTWLLHVVGKAKGVDMRESTARVSRELRLHMASRKDSAMRGEREEKSEEQEGR